MKYSAKNTKRFQNIFEAVEVLVKDFGLTNQQATHYVWDNQFTMGTDRGVWLNMPEDED